MHRRQFVAAASVGFTSILAGCSDEPGGGIDGGLEVTDVTASNTIAGNVELGVLVSNSSSESASATLYGEVDVEGGDAYTESRSITVSPDGSNSYELGIDVAVSDSLSGSSYEYRAWVEA
ncbi:hypothetical protein SAMN06269185_1713 [Natronoarchaeum philippinense]|uniref:Uncharacterized protein n=1 Tax=Natronoarchaeum philippinense TaxID=558529 RepID=A0A285NTT6_NATPI|nr:hypothetical protein [Natronoarchaeum philippinense]SNZ12417.1 hypothetical protein SAMN06269185_1713 [Natronoarchaeum philippinense]